MKHIFHIKMRVMFWAMLGFVFFAFAPSVIHAANCGGEPSVSSSASWQAYKSWCSCMGGSVNSNFNTAQAEGGCKLPSDSDSSSSSSGESAGTMLGRALGKALGKMIFGDPEEDARRNAAAARDREATDAARQAQERAKAEEAAAARQRKQAEAERIERDRIAEEKRLQEEADFIRKRDEGANTLRDPFGTRVTSNDGTPRRGSTVDTGIRDLKPAKEVRDLGGKQAAWKQLNCAAAISGDAFASLSSNGKPDYDEFHNLASEAMKALNGERLGVVCPTTPPFPDMHGRAVDMDQVRESEKKILSRAVVIVERMKQRGDKPDATQQSKPPANETPDEKMRLVQRELNEKNSQKNTGKTQQEIDQQERDRKELTNLILANNRIEKGELDSVSFDTKEEAAPTPRRKSVPAP